MVSPDFSGHTWECFDGNVLPTIPPRPDAAAEEEKADPKAIRVCPAQGYQTWEEGRTR